MGRLIEKGSVSFSIGKIDTDELNPITIPDSSWVSVAYDSINRLYPGETQQINVNISSGKLLPGRYRFKINIEESVPNESPISWLNKTLEKMDIAEDEKDAKRKEKIKECEERGINPYEKPKSYTPQPLCNYQFNEIMKVHSLSSVAGIIGALVGSTIVAAGTFAYATIRIIQDFWPE